MTTFGKWKELLPEGWYPYEVIDAFEEETQWGKKKTIQFLLTLANGRKAVFDFRTSAAPSPNNPLGKFLIVCFGQEVIGREVEMREVLQKRGECFVTRATTPNGGQYNKITDFRPLGGQ